MTRYELLLEKIRKEVPVIELPLLWFGSEGNYYDEVIYIDSSLPENRKLEILSEEYAHHKTSVGNISNYNDPESRKQEWTARRYSIERLISLDDLLECHSAGATNLFQCSEYLSLSEELLLEAFQYYQNKFGFYHYYKGKHFYFSDCSVKISDLHKIS